MRLFKGYDLWLADREVLSERIYKVAYNPNKVEFEKTQEIENLLYEYEIIRKPYEKDNKGNALSRLTLPLYYLSALLVMIFVLPIIYLQTGNWYLKKEGKLSFIFRKWAERI